jgi:Ca2+-binding RTX toxin-like protein
MLDDVLRRSRALAALDPSGRVMRAFGRPPISTGEPQEVLSDALDPDCFFSSPRWPCSRLGPVPSIPTLRGHGRSYDRRHEAGTTWLHGTGGADVICGRGGADELHGAGGNDVLRGGRGDDSLFGNGWNDLLVRWGPGGDFVSDGRGNDLMNGCRRAADFNFGGVR